MSKRKPIGLRYKTKVVPLALTTGLLLGLGVTAGTAVTLNSPLRISLGETTAHAKTVHRDGKHGSFTLGKASVASYPYVYYGAGAWPYSLHNSPDGFVYCINIGMVDGFVPMGRAILDADGKVPDAATGGMLTGANLDINTIRNSGVLALMQMAGKYGYQGLLKYKDSIFDGMEPSGVRSFAGGGYVRWPGANYAYVMQVAVHLAEDPEFYAHGGGAGYFRSLTFKRNVRSWANGTPAPGGMWMHCLNGQNYSGNQIAEMASKLLDYAKKNYHAPSLADISKQSFTVDLQARGKKYDRTEKNQDDWGGFAETKSVTDYKKDPSISQGDALKSVSIKAEKNYLPDNSDGKFNNVENPTVGKGKAGHYAGLLGTEPIAITGKNMDDKDTILSLSNIKADPDFDVQLTDGKGNSSSVTIHSKAMQPSDVLGYQISTTTTSTGQDNSTKIDADQIKWNTSGDNRGIHKLGEKVNFKDLNGHYIRLIVKDGVKGFDTDPKDKRDNGGNGNYGRPNRFSWNGSNALTVQLNSTIPAAKMDYPLAVAYLVHGSAQDYTGSHAVQFVYNAVDLNAKMIFHVRQDNHTDSGGGGDDHQKEIRPVPKHSLDKITTEFHDDTPDIVNRIKNSNHKNGYVDTFSDGKDQQLPKMFEKASKDQKYADTLQPILSQKPLLDNDKLIPGKEYAYTLHLKTGSDIRKAGSEQIEQLEAKDLKLPKWFVYKTAVASVGKDSKHQTISSEITRKAQITYKLKADGSGSVRFVLPQITHSAKLNEALKPAITSDAGEVDVTIFGTIDPNAQFKANGENHFTWAPEYDTEKVLIPGSTPHPKVKRIHQDTEKGVFVGSPSQFMDTLKKVNPKFAETAGVIPSGNKTDHLNLQSDNLKIARIRGLNTNETGDQVGAYGNGSNKVITPDKYKGVLTNKVDIQAKAEKAAKADPKWNSLDHNGKQELIEAKGQKMQKQLYYVVIANSGNDFANGKKDSDGFKRLHFNDYLDPNLKLDTKNRPMITYDLSQMETHKAGNGGAIMTPFRHAGLFNRNGSFNDNQMFAASSTGDGSYMSNIVYSTPNQLSADGKTAFGVSADAQKALSTALGTYANPDDRKAWKDGVGKVGSKNYTKFYRTLKDGKYVDHTKLGAIEDTDGSYDANRHLDGAGNTIGWYAFAHGGPENGSTSATRDLDGRQRISWTVTGDDAQELTAHTLMFMIPVQVKDNATYVTNNNQTPDIQNDAFFHGYNTMTPPPDDNPHNPKTTDDIETFKEVDGIPHGNGGGYSNTAVINPIRKDTLLTKKQTVTPVAKPKNEQADSLKIEKTTELPQHRQFDDQFTYHLSIRMPNWADKANLDDMRGQDAKFQFYDKLELPYDVKDVTVYDETAHKKLVTNLKQGLETGQIALEKQSKWDDSKIGLPTGKASDDAYKVVPVNGQTGEDIDAREHTQHPKVVYRPYAQVTSKHPQELFKLANHKLSMRVKVNAPFEQGEDNKRLGKISNAKTDAIYDKYMEEHKETKSHLYRIGNTFGVTRQSTVNDENDGDHGSNTVYSEYGDKLEVNVDAMRIDTNKFPKHAKNGYGDNFKIFFSSKIPFGHDNNDMTGKLRVDVIATKKDNPYLSENKVTLYRDRIDLDKLANVKNIRSFGKNADEYRIDTFQQGSQGVGKKVLNGRLRMDQLSAQDRKYISGISLRDGKNHEINYLKPDNLDANGGVKVVDSNQNQQTYDKNRRPLYVRVRVTGVEQNKDRDMSINGDRSFKNNTGRFINPFEDGLVARADVAYQNGIDPRFATISPESSYSYYGQNREGAKVGKYQADKHRGISMIQTLYDVTQLHRFDKQGNPTEKQGNVDQTIGAGAGDGIRDDVRLQRFGWGNLESHPAPSSSNRNTSTKKLLRNDKMQFIFDTQLQNGSGVKYKVADKDSIVDEAMRRYQRSTGANVENNWTSPNTFWSVRNGQIDFHEGRAKANGYRFFNTGSDDYRQDMLHANVESEPVSKGNGNAKYYTVPRAVEHENALADQTNAYGSKVNKMLTNMQTSKIVIDGGKIQNYTWKKNANGELADNAAKNLILDNQTAITSIDNAPNSKQSGKGAVEQASSMFETKAAKDGNGHDELATDGGSFFTTEIGNNYKNYKFYQRVLHRGTGQVKVADKYANDDADVDVLSSKFNTSNARAKKMPGVINGGEKFYLPLWFTNDTEHDTFGKGTGEASINPLIYYSDGNMDRINADYSDVNFTRWLRIFGHRYGFDDSNSSDFDSILISGHLGGSKSKALNDHENRALNNAQSFNRQGTPAGMKD